MDHQINASVVSVSSWEISPGAEMSNGRAKSRATLHFESKDQWWLGNRFSAQTGNHGLLELIRRMLITCIHSLGHFIHFANFISLTSHFKWWNAVSSEPWETSRRRTKHTLCFGGLGDWDLEESQWTSAAGLVSRYLSTCRISSIAAG